MVTLVVEMALVGALAYGVPLLWTVTSAVADPLVVLATFLAARFLAFRLYQWRRDYLATHGELWIRNSGSAGALVTVASFSLVGLVPAAALFPFVNVRVSEHMTFLSAAIATITVPTCYLLLVYHLGELSAADRHRRRFRVSPAMWHFLWSLPAIVFVWMVVSGTTWTLSTDSVAPPFVALVDGLRVGRWVVGYVALCAPTLVALAYTLRRLTGVLFAPLPRR